MSFVFLLQGLVLDMDLCEKISNFISHYQDHKEYDGDSFIDFVVEDYFNDNGDKEGHHNGFDQKIPSHTSNQCCHPVVFLASSQWVDFKVIRLENRNKFDNYSFNFNSRYLESPFQPPRA
ncbi:hypothetical protein DHD80_10720 [Gramella sp. AN32]|nr:hypothetical protein [Gramella sp. AN32]